MYNIRNIENDIIRVGVSDRKLTTFEAVFPLQYGIAYNSYIIRDEKTALFDTVDKHCAKTFLENIKSALNSRNLDYLILHHMEPDHSALIRDILDQYSGVQIVCTKKASDMLKQFGITNDDTNILEVKENDTLSLGKHKLHFITAPMVHWPEVMITYESTTKSLFSADAFGSFGAVNGNISDKEVTIGENYINETRRYYTNIVGKYGVQVQALLKKINSFEIKRICPLHGLILEENIELFVEKYNKWSKYEPEEKGIVIAYSSIYGGTENAIDVLATKLAEKGVKNIKMFDTSITHNSYILAEMFKYSHIIIGANTYNNGIFATMENLIHTIVAHGLKNRKFAIIQNGSWAPNCGTKIEELVKNCGNEIIAEPFTIKSVMQESQNTEMETFAENIINSLQM